MQVFLFREELNQKNLIDIFKKSEIFSDTKPFSVHRLDKDTSGVFLMAKIEKQHNY